MKFFRIKTYGKTQLARMYFPQLSPKAAYKRLATMIGQEPELKDIGFRTKDGRRGWYLTPMEVRRIVEVLGAPF